MSRQDDNPTTQRTLFSPGPERPAAGSACVVVIHGEGLGKRMDIGRRAALVGRSADADLHIPHGSVSRRHCELWFDGQRYRLRDLGATNQTQLNDEPVNQAVLEDGDQITVGETILKFIGGGSIEARYHEEVYQLATLDPLTELTNRRHFQEQLEREIARATRHERPLSICIIDVDKFKPINDRYGHIAGDGVLRQLAAIMRAHVREEDVAARIGGEEFAVMFPETGVEAAERFAERLREAVAEAEFLVGGQRHPVTVSIGIASLSQQRRERGGLMQGADAALYEAKRSGRNRVCVDIPSIPGR